MRPRPDQFRNQTAAYGVRRGFTLLELLLVVAVIAILIGILVPVVGSVRRSATSIQCINNLRGIAMALQQYATIEHSYPDPFANRKSWEASLRRLLPVTGIFVCPADGEVAPAIGSSYDWRDTGKPETTMAGRPFSSCQRMEAVIVFDALPGWHAPGRMNAARMNGSVETMDQRDCLHDLTKAIR